MPTYTVPVQDNGANEILEAAKNFMQSRDYARQFMGNVWDGLKKTHGPDGAFGDIYGGGGLNLSDRDLLAGVLTAEGGSDQDRRYILDVIKNRIASPSYPNDLRGVLLQPGQFSALNAVTGYAGGEGANDLWRQPTAGSASLADIFVNNMFSGGQTGGALNYYQPDLASPAWGGPQFRSLPGSTHVFGSA